MGMPVGASRGFSAPISMQVHTAPPAPPPPAASNNASPPPATLNASGHLGTKLNSHA